MPIMEIPEEDTELLSRFATGIEIASLPSGSVVALPIVVDYGAGLKIDLRAHFNNVAGPVPVSEEVLEELGAVNPEEQLEELLETKRRLEEVWTPVIIGREEEEFEEIETPVPVE